MKFIRLYTIEGSCWNIDFKCWEELLNAYEQFQLYNTPVILELSTPEGSSVVLSSARIADFSESTPDSRRRAAEIGNQLQAESGFRDE